MRAERVIVLLLLLGAVGAGAAPRVLLPSGREVEGTAVQADENGQIFLTTGQGRLTFPPGTTVITDPPPAFESAQRELAAGRHAAAASLLKGVIAEYRFLGWDRQAERLLAEALIGQGAFAEAAPLYEKVFAHTPAALNDADARIHYLEALQQTGADAKLAAELETVIRSGPRAAAARAQLMRGAARLAAGDAGAAVMDFMRTADLFRDVPVTRPEALYWTGEALAALGDARAREYYQLTVDAFGDSPFAARAREKLR